MNVSDTNILDEQQHSGTVFLECMYVCMYSFTEYMLSDYLLTFFGFIFLFTR